MDKIARRSAQVAGIMSKTTTSKPLKILMLHGYTQSGNTFYAKSSALRKYILKAFPNSQLSYPTGPMNLRPSDVPGQHSSNENEEDDSESFGWWRRSDNIEPVEYVGFRDGISTIAKVMAAEGPFDGVIGFSQGACAAVMVASLLEGSKRKESFASFHSTDTVSIPYPPSFEALDHPPLKFCVAYSGFPAPGPRYQAFYDPLVSTPVLHIIGTLDTAVEEPRTTALINVCGGEEKTKVLRHPGGHFVPSQRLYVEAVADFIRKATSGGSLTEKVEDKVEDMDVPF